MSSETDKRILVTGADGFLGTNTVRELLSRGYAVRGFVESGRSTKTLDDLDVERFEGDIRECDTVARAASGCHYIVHTAASTNVWPSRSRLLEEINIEGTRNVVRAALSENVERIIHIGTANSCGAGTLDAPGDETTPYNAGRYGLGYIETKLEAQRLIENSVNHSGLPAVILAPTYMIGPYDTKPGSGRMILELVHGNVPGYSRGGRNFVYVKDVAVAIANALRQGRIGETYIVGNENLTYRDFFRLVVSVTDGKMPRFRAPSVFIRSLGVFGSLSGYISGKPPKISLPMARVACDGHYYTAAKAVRELSMPRTPIRRAVEEAIQWFRDNGYIDGYGEPDRCYRESTII